MPSAEPLAILAVFGALALAFFWARRKGFVHLAAGRSGKQVRVIERVALTPQHSLFVVETGDERLLLSVSGSGCQVLRSLPRGAGGENR
jgi:flagellar biogenesis protein FliO